MKLTKINTIYKLAEFNDNNKIVDEILFTDTAKIAKYLDLDKDGTKAFEIKRQDGELIGEISSQYIDNLSNTEFNSQRVFVHSINDIGVMVFDTVKEYCIYPEPVY